MGACRGVRGIAWLAVLVVVATLLPAAGVPVAAQEPTAPDAEALVPPEGAEDVAAAEGGPAAGVAGEGWTPFSHWVSDEHGETTAELYATPAFRRGPAGWQRIDPTVRPGADPALPLVAEGAVRPVRFGRAADRLVEVGLARGPVTLSAPDLAVGAPVHR